MNTELRIYPNPADLEIGGVSPYTIMSVWITPSIDSATYWNEYYGASAVHLTGEFRFWHRAFSNNESVDLKGGA